ncbi:hypothetical protein LOY69_29050 [Pseudomonas sp. B21-059]|uniref:hypothetical protein n=1 Tax=Pseudomonas sp. B21-059 TaxID=2895496 RepID=UPI0022342A19|nr:hypothetical protein [Pseudomonas sp. B21-059]UZE34689.1 hypothetical protein LOY69_29050 [Pseudomonas sp. B21-059]
MSFTQGLSAYCNTCADQRLSDTTQVTRLRLKKGQHRLTLGKTGELRFKLDQRYQVISLRRVGDQLFVIAPAPLEKNPLAAWFDHQ